MSPPEDSDYVCTLDEVSVKKAREELNEDPKERLGSVQTLRKWIKDQPHLTCPTDTTSLLSYLRARYFNQLNSRTLIETNMKQKTKLPNWYSNMNTRDPEFLEIVDEGLSVRLPGRDKEGREVIVIRQASKEFMKTHGKDAMLKSIATLVEVCLQDEMTQVNGTVLVIDFTGATMKNFTHMSVDDRRKFFGHMQGNTPYRIKQFHLYNMGALADFIVGITKIIMSEKLRSRMKVHSYLDSLYEYIPMEILPDEYLPDDYTGPSGGPLADITADIRKLVTSDSMHEKIKYISSEQFRLDKNKRLKDIPQESYRPLHVD